ncbi:MAG: neutral/alkaline non-lysosomal ceramidase N-terminal domain-containing protein [Armatimonadota bacterium]|nr:neutral/alkaline non-lysosomal ceramidase N-terminal domain-containing protein [Armatimonadota bacterium]
MRVGTAKIDITPSFPVWMDGMIREHKSTGVHDPLYARAMCLYSDSLEEGCVIVSVDVCAIRTEDSWTVRKEASERTGLRAENIIIAATHTHSGPATKGFFNPVEDAYVAQLQKLLIELIEQATTNASPAVVGCTSGEENTISHYRRLLADDGHVVMNWEPWPAERIVRPLGQPDNEVGVVVTADASNPNSYLGILFNHAGHPNVMSGDNYLLSADYPGYACAQIEQNFGGTAIFVNGAEGSVDIDGLRDRDWEGVTRTGGALARAVIGAVRKADLRSDIAFAAEAVRYCVPRRVITQEELAWAERVLASTGGKIQAQPDGIGADFKAVLYKKLADQQGDVEIEQTCIAIGDTALISFPGELFTEIGREIKLKSPFKRTYIIGLANGSVGYVPTREAISQGGYEVDTRQLDDDAADIILEQSLELLKKTYTVTTATEG